MDFGAVGNFDGLKGLISLRKPRTQALYENHKHSIILSTADPVDEIMLTDRSDFQMSNATPEEIATSNNGNSPLLKKRVPAESEFMNQLDEPLINLMSDF